MTTDTSREELLRLTSEIVAAHLGHNPVSAEQVPGVIRAVYAKDEVLVRLLDLNAQRADEEAAAGLAPSLVVDDETDANTLAEADA